MTWAVAMLMENKSIRMFRTWKQADWRDKKAGRRYERWGLLAEGMGDKGGRAVQDGKRETCFWAD